MGKTASAWILTILVVRVDPDVAVQRARLPELLATD